MSSEQPPTLITRRGFLNALIIGIGTVISLVLAVPGIGYLLAPVLGRQRREAEWDAIAEVSQLTPSSTPFARILDQQVQDAWMKTTDKRTIWITYEGEGRIQALSGRCTHLGCTVHWDTARNLFACPCHGGLYNAKGEVIGGPPPKPLHRLDTKIQDGKLWIRGDQYA